MPRYPNPDLITDYNNGTIAIQPVKTGRLGHLAKVNPDGSEKCWVFGEVHHYEHDGFERFGHVRRGVLMGNLTQGKAFLEMAKELLRVNNGMYVPFSNGQRVSAKVEGTREGEYHEAYMNDYAWWDLKLARVDALPTREQISDAIECTRGFKLNITYVELNVGETVDLWVIGAKPDVECSWRIEEGEGEVTTTVGSETTFRATKPGRIVLKCKQPFGGEGIGVLATVTIIVSNMVPMD